MFWTDHRLSSPFRRAQHLEIKWVIKMITDLASRTITIKVVYFGCAMSGKTTSLKRIFEKMGHIEDLRSIETQAGRTLFFDWGSILFESGGWKIKVDLWSATGQDFYAQTRPTILTGADGIIFVADSLPTLIKENEASWIELMSLITNIQKKVPVVISLNKRDNPLAIPINDFKKRLALRDSIDILETIATTGVNVDVCLKKVLQKILHP